MQTVRAANDKGRDVQTEQLGPVASPWVSADIGTVGVTGSADETSGTFTIEGGGANIGGTEDAFHFVYQTLYGDGSITANAASLSGGGTTPGAGLMMRDSLADDAAHVSAAVQGNRIRLLDRVSAGGNTSDALGHNQGAPEWIRIERSGSTFTLSRSNDGSSWAVMDTRTISMGTMIYIGMAVTGNSTSTLATGVFDNVATTGSGATPTPTATNTPLPTNTPTVTNTPVSTNTPTPTNTPPPSPTPAPDVWIKRSSYSIAGQVVAVRVTGDPVSANNGLFYVLSDHLGSTSLLVNSSGGVVGGSTTRYLPFGGYRGTAPSQSITDRDFTGQKENRELGLLYYQARFYVPGIGRFASADTIVPDKNDPQSLNRYTYTRNDPVKFTDPSGHCWGIFSGLRNTFYSTTCENIDQALTIVQHPNANVGEKIVAGGYVLVEAAAHACVALCIPGAYAAESAAVTATATSVGTAACADGNCTNEATAVVNGASNAIQAISADGNPNNELEAVQTGVNTVYQSVQNGVTRYVGITNDFARRAAEHAGNGRVIQRIPGLTQLSRYDARAVEQQLIEIYRLQKNGGILENIYNSIASTNPIYPEAIQRGIEILTKTGNMPQ